MAEGREQAKELSTNVEAEASLSKVVADAAEFRRWRERERLGLEEGKVVIKGKERPYKLHEQGIIREYANNSMIDTATDHWMLFEQRIPKHSGRHVHQGSLCLFVIEGKGYTVVDGVRNDWEDGDLILLPIKPGGVEHQHFNMDESKASRWFAMICRPLREFIGRRTWQREFGPDWKSIYGNKAARWESDINSESEKK